MLENDLRVCHSARCLHLLLICYGLVNILTLLTKQVII